MTVNTITKILQKKVTEMGSKGKKWGRKKWDEEEVLELERFSKFRTG